MEDTVTLKQKIYSKNALVIGDVLTRVVIGLMFTIAGFGKLFGGLAGFSGALESMGFPMNSLLAFVVAFIEFFGGILLILGIKTDIVAVLLAAIMFVAMVIAHASDGWAILGYRLLLFVSLLRYVGTSGYVTIKNIFRS